MLTSRIKAKLRAFADCIKSMVPMIEKSEEIAGRFPEPQRYGHQHEDVNCRKGNGQGFDDEPQAEGVQTDEHKVQQDKSDAIFAPGRVSTWAFQRWRVPWHANSVLASAIEDQAAWLLRPAWVSSRRAG